MTDSVATSEMPGVSCVVIAHNELTRIEECLCSIVTQDAAARLEVIVVDDGSTDGTDRLVATIAERHRNVRLVRLATNQGRGAARARGLQEANAELVAYVDADIVLPTDWLSQCLEAIVSADAVGGQAVPDGDVAYIYRRFGLEPRPVAATTIVTGNNGLYRREVLVEAGFDASLREGEDVAVNHALAAHKARLRTIPELYVRHEEDKSLAQSVVWLFQSGRGAGRQFHRYRQVRVPDLVFGGWLTVCGTAGVLSRRHRGALALPLLYVGTAAFAHVSRAFVLRRDLRGVAAVLVDMGLLTAYFAGRVQLHAGTIVRAYQREHCADGTA